MRMLITAIIAILGLLTVATVASADHAWSVYHWPGDNLNPTVVDRTSSPLYDVPAGVLEWADLGTRIQPEMSTGGKADIKVGESVIRSSSFLGLAGIYLDADGHITKAEVVLNTRLLVDYDPAVADLVLCQEIGHILGLDHNRDGDTGGLPDDTCMNDRVDLFDLSAVQQHVSPNDHDTDQLNAIYGHTDPISGGDDGGGGGGGCPPGNPNHPKCSGSAGQWITIHVFWAP